MEANYITKQIAMDNLSIPPGVEIRYTTWTVRDYETNEVVFHEDMDKVNLVDKVFTNVFEIGKKYLVTASMVRSDGPTIQTDPLVVAVTDNVDIINIYPIPSVVDTPILSAEHSSDSIPTSNFRIKAGPLLVNGNAVHERTSWWLVDDNNQTIWESLDDEANLTSIVVRNISLSVNKLYTMHCVFKANNRDYSGTGTYTFRASDMSELDIIGDLNDSYYNKELVTSLRDVKDGVDKFEYELRSNTNVLLYSDTNQSGSINIPKQYNNKDVLDQSDGIEFYILRIRLTMGALVVGWREFSFTPKIWRVESDVTNDTTYNQLNGLSSKRITIDGCVPSSFASKHPAGVIYQLHDGLFLMHYENGKYGLFKWIEEVFKFSLVKEVNLMEILPANNKKTNDWFMTCKVLKNGLVAVQPFKESGSVSTLYILEYNTVNKEFKYLRATNGVMVTSPTISDDILVLMENGMVYTYDTVAGIKYAVGETPFLGLESRLLTFKIANYRYKVNDPVNGESIIVTIANDGKSAVVSSKFADTILPDLNWTTRAVMRNGKSYIYQKEVGTGAVRLYGLNSNISGVSYFVDGDSDVVGRLDQEIVLDDGRRILFNAVAPDKSIIFS